MIKKEEKQMEESSKELSLLDYWIVIRDGKWIILLVVFLISSITLEILLHTPNTYLADTTIMAIEASGNGLASTLSSVPLGLSGMAGFGSSNISNRFLAILQSRTIAENVIQKLDLVDSIYPLAVEPSFFLKLFKKPSKEKPAQRVKLNKSVRFLHEHVTIHSNKKGKMNLKVEWRTSTIAADIANAYIDELGVFLSNHALNSNMIVLDPALPPIDKFKPQVIKITVFAFIGSLFLGIVTAFLRVRLIIAFAKGNTYSQKTGD